MEAKSEWNAFWTSYMAKRNNEDLIEKITEDFEIPDLNVSDSVKRVKLYNRLKSYRSGDRKRSQRLGKRSICDYTPLEFKELVLNGRCEYCADNRWNILGLDRLDNSLGHTKANTVLCCRTCNSIKGNDQNNIGYTKMKKLGRIVKVLKTMELDDNEGRRVLKIIGKNVYPKPAKRWELHQENMEGGEKK